MFEVHRITNYDEETNLGRAIVVMNKNNVRKAIEFIYMVDKNDIWSFHYENGTCLTEEDKRKMENWFITCR